MDKFISREAIYEILRDFHAIETLQVAKTEEFLAEVAFLDHWNADQQAETGYDGRKTIEIFDTTENGIPSITIEITHNSGNIVNLIYSIDPELPGRLGLIILQSDNVVYARCPHQDPATEWDINCMANDPEITDEDGDILFVGEPTNI